MARIDNAAGLPKGANTAPAKSAPVQKAKSALPASPASQDLTGSLGDTPATPASGQVDKAEAKTSELTKWAEVLRVAKVHAGPAVSTPTIRYYRAGTLLQVVDRQSGWAKIVDPTGARQGWIYEKYLTLKYSPTQVKPAKRPSAARRLPKSPGWRRRRAYPPNFGFAIRVYPGW